MESQETLGTTLLASIPAVERFSEDALPPGTMLNGRYRIDAFIGQGGFGIAYIATPLHGADRVVIKEYLPREFARRSRTNASVVVGQSEHRETYAHGLQSFLNEARLLQSFDEPSIVRVLEIFPDNDTAYLVMPYEEGKTLGELLKAGYRFEERELRRIFLQLLDGLKVVHAAGYLHRDIKPSNIIIRNADHRPILIDFGAARQSLVERSRSVSAMLTPGYAPYEQYPGYSKRQGRWSDLYSVGVTLYQAVTHCGEDTLEQGNANVRLEALHTGAPDPLIPAVQAAAHLCSHELLSTIDWMMRPRIEDRPQTVEAVQNCLLGRSFVPTLTLAARPVPPAVPQTTLHREEPFAQEPGRARGRRSGWMAALGGVAAGLGAAAMAAWLVFLSPGKLPLIGSDRQGMGPGGVSVDTEQTARPRPVDASQQSAPPASDPVQASLPGGDLAASSSSPVATDHPQAAPEPELYTVSVNPNPPTAHVEIVGVRQSYRPGMSLPPKRYRLHITAPSYAPFEGTLNLKSDVRARVKLCKYVTRTETTQEPVQYTRTQVQQAVQNLTASMPIPYTEGGRLIQMANRAICVNAQQQLRTQLSSQCQSLGGQGSAYVEGCDCRPVSTWVNGRLRVTTTCGVNGSMACSIARNVSVPETRMVPVSRPRTVVDPECPAPALSY